MIPLIHSYLLAQAHLRLVQVAIEPSCDADMKKAIQGDILALRTLRESIIHQFQENYNMNKGENENDYNN